MSRLDALADLGRVLADSYGQQTAFALEADGRKRLEALEAVIGHLKAYAEAQARLSCAYDPMAWRSLDGEEIGRRWSEATATWWPKRFFAKRSVVKAMRLGGAVGKPDPAADAVVLTRLRKEGEAIDQIDALLSSLQTWKKHSTDPEAAQVLCDLGGRARTAISRLVDDPPALAEVRASIKTLLYDGNDLLAPDGPVGRAIGDYLVTLDKLRAVSADFEALASCDVREAFARSDRALELLRETAETIIAHRSELNAWCAWRKRRTQALDLNLAPLVTAVEQGMVSPDDIPATFEAAYCAWWSARVIEEDDVLRQFSSAEHTETILNFRQLDTDFQKTTADYIASRLSGEIPHLNDVARGPQWGVLRREIEKKKRHMPLRQLMQEAAESVTTLAPCLMMSPLSVAQYLPPGQALFDVVIFDEASQITVWDAVGSIARGRQVIVAGDPKQMPPSNFFNRSDEDPDGDVDYEGDLESILDELRSASIPEHTLNLHYRSRRESLIAFSNSRYYDSKLITFPAPVHPDRGVRLVRPDGFYARGKARHNEGEARAIVAEVVRRLSSRDEVERARTIGVVTFNTEQQSLIENLLDKERAANPGIEWAFAEDHQEPVFVKNLETVQGDERDVILFSITYGLDQSGHMTMNFGPLNRDGGERRLNVAMTRAREEMVVFSTLHPDRIDLSRTNSEAVKDLKHFLEYAERGPVALAASVQGSLGDFESPFEMAVSRALQEKGWSVHPQIGVSAFRIDLGIVHPDAPGIYLAGVECDGAMYHSAAVARERDRIRQAVLEGLGWTLFRVWSTEWWINGPGALEKLDRQLREHLQADRCRRQEAMEVTQDIPSASDASTDEPGDDASAKTWVLPSEGTLDLVEASSACKQTPEPVRHARQRVSVQCVTQDDALASDHTAVLPDDTEDRHRYVRARLDGVACRPDPEHFYNGDYELRLNVMIDHVIDTEGPIHENVLIHRIARHHGFQRAGRQIREIVSRLAKHRRGRTQEDVGLFFWRKGTVKDRLAPARYEGREDEERKVEHICAEELRAIAGDLNIESDIVGVARALGIARLSQSARHRLELVLLTKNKPGHGEARRH